MPVASMTVSAPAVSCTGRDGAIRSPSIDDVGPDRRRARAVDHDAAPDGDGHAGAPCSAGPGRHTDPLAGESLHALGAQLDADARLLPPAHRRVHVEGRDPVGVDEDRAGRETGDHVVGQTITANRQLLVCPAPRDRHRHWRIPHRETIRQRHTIRHHRIGWTAKVGREGRRVVADQHTARTAWRIHHQVGGTHIAQARRGVGRRAVLVCTITENVQLLVCPLPKPSSSPASTPPGNNTAAARYTTPTHPPDCKSWSRRPAGSW